MSLTVLVADPDPRAPAAFAGALYGTEYTLVAAVSNGKALLDTIAKLTPWAIAVSLSLPDHELAPDVGWVGTVHHLGRIAPHMLTMVTFTADQRGLVPSSLADGARAYAEKPFLREEILAALDHLGTDEPAAPYFARARRIPRTLPFRFSCGAAGSTLILRDGVLRDLSETGFRIAVPESLAQGSVVSLDLTLPDWTTIHGRTQVVRECSAPEPGLREYGVALFEIEPSQRARLRGFISRILSGEVPAAGDASMPETRRVGGVV